jgi:hypothetical protein
LTFIVIYVIVFIERLGKGMAKNISGFFTDKGNVSVKVRNELKTKQLAEIKSSLGISYPNVVIGKDNAYYIEIGNSNGVSIYARLELTISTKSPND